MKYSFYQPESIYEMGRRKTQEDALYPLPSAATVADRFFVVCDGMGGIDRGEVASATVAAALGRFWAEQHHADEPFTDVQFAQALDAAYDQLDAADNGTEPRMGTTMTLLCFHRGGCLMAHLGDSRIYHLRPSTGEILYRSRDHSLVSQQYEQGEITLEQMRTSKHRNIILRAMQPKQPSRTPADLVHTTDIRPGDYFLACTDGILERLYDQELLSLLGDDTLTDRQKADRLREMTSANHDNHSAYLIHVEAVVAEESDAAQPNDEAQARAQCRALNDTSDQVEVTLLPDDDAAAAASDDDGESGLTSFIGDSPDLSQLNMTPPQVSRPSRWSLVWLLLAVVLVVALCLAHVFLGIP